MPTAQQQRRTVNARRFAALLAGFDTGNASEEEALAKGRALRRMAIEAGLRVVDVLELPDVRKAVDEQLQPKRGGDHDLSEALELAAALREELTERTRDVRKFAELLKQQEEKTALLSQDLAKAKALAQTQPPPARHSFGAQCWQIESAMVGAAVVMFGQLIGDILWKYFFER